MTRNVTITDVDISVVSSAIRAAIENIGWPLTDADFPVIGREVLRVAVDVLTKSERERHGLVPMFKILAASSKITGSSVPLLCCKRRSPHLALARQVVYWVAHRQFGHTLPNVAHAIGGRDHTTVLHGVQKIDRAFHDDLCVRSTIDGIMLELGYNLEIAA